MDSKQTRIGPERAEAILYGLAAAVVILFGLVLVVREFTAGEFTSVRALYASVVLLLCGTGLGVHLCLRRIKILRLGSWFALAALLVEVSCFAFLWAYNGSPPVPRSFAPLRQFVFHPSLVGLPRPNFHGKIRDVAEKVTVTHNAVGARGLEQFDPTKMSILAIGGSTTYDVAVNDRDTWVAHLSRAISNRFNVLNFGVPAQTTAQHIIFTALRASAYSPRCILFYVGWNDIRNAHLTHLEPDYSNFDMLSQYDDLGVINRYYSWLALGSMVRIVSAKVLNIPGPDEAGHVADTSDPRLEKIYRRNVKLLAVITKAIGARPIFIPQILNYNKDNASSIMAGWIPYISQNAVMAVMRRFNEILRDEAEIEGAVFIAAPMTYAWKPSDFVDAGHFSATGSETFSRLIAPDVIRACE
jgi:lysophospholipase L1-like esterase